MLSDNERIIFRHSYWDIIPALCGIMHLALLISWYCLFSHVPFYVNILVGFLYSYCIVWNIESISHNLIHNPFFKSEISNRIYSVLMSVAVGFSQQYFKVVHIRHHIGNSDLPDANGNTRDWFSIYRFGRDGRAEPALSYCIKGLFRGDSAAVYEVLSKHNMAIWAKFENWGVFSLFIVSLIGNWRFALCFIPFYYLGHIASMAVGYYEHFNADPNNPIAWGVSSYGRVYNFLWFNNGHHAEHHYRPRQHWTKMPELRKAVAGKAGSDKIRVIHYPHALGFLEYWPKIFNFKK